MAGGGGGQQQQQGGGDNALAPLWIVAFFFFVGIIIWYLYHDFIVSTIFHVKMFEAQLVSLFTNRLTPIMAEMVSMPISDVTFDHLTRLSVEIGTVVRYPIIVILLLLAWLMYVSGITSRFKQTYDMRKLLEAEVGNWPHATPVVGLDLLKESLDSGPWAMAKPPLEFSIENKLLKQDEKKGPISWSKRKEPPPLTIRRNEAKGLFKLQMGERWKSPNALNGHTKALFAIFAAKYARDNDYLALVHQLSRTAAVGKINYSGTSALLRKHANDKKVVEVTQKHAYVYTVMASMLELSRQEGVFPTAEFLWLRPLDRPLWLMLNTIGRQTPFTEVAGPFAHWIVEKEFGRRCIYPFIDEAVNALEVAVKEIKYRPKEGEI